MTDFEKKQQLIIRDPLTRELDQLIQGGLKAELRFDKKAGKKHLDQVMSRINVLAEKWNVNIKVKADRSKKIVGWDYYYFALRSRPKMGNHTVVIDGREINEIVHKEEYDLENRPAETGMLYFRPHEVPLLVDLSTLTLKDAERVKKQAWEIVEKYLRERGINKGRKWEPSAPSDEPTELGFLYHCRNKTFDHYLKWYDLHMGEGLQTPKGLPFRTIACHEYLERELPDKAEEAKKILAERTKTIRSSRGERIIKGFIGEPIRGEDVVEKGVKLIYKAIHRKPYPALKRLGLFNCPEHGKDCPLNCDHFKAWYKEFNKKHFLFKPLYTSAEPYKPLPFAKPLKPRRIP